MPEKQARKKSVSEQKDRPDLMKRMAEIWTIELRHQWETFVASAVQFWLWGQALANKFVSGNQFSRQLPGSQTWKTNVAKSRLKRHTAMLRQAYRKDCPFRLSQIQIPIPTWVASDVGVDYHPIPATCLELLRNQTDSHKNGNFEVHGWSRGGKKTLNISCKDIK